MLLSLEKKKEKKAPYALLDQDFEDLDKVKDKITSGLSSFEVSEGDDALFVTEKFQQVSSVVTEALEIPTVVITPESGESSSGRRAPAPRRAPITLEDAVLVIRSLEKSNPEQEKTIFTRDEINAKV